MKSGENEVPKSHQRKPDPSEPWRYVCPECSCNVNGKARTQKYECKSCGGYFHPEELHDQKGGINA